ncbi:hypothetical protein BHE74_00046034 [Ensete ventricosum]|nr:hypothetical protein BHE74_00046034 [Ensete ventricosum]
MHRVGVRTMQLGTRQEYVVSSSWVLGACQDGTREFAKRRPRLVGRLSGVAEMLTGKGTTFPEIPVGKPLVSGRKKKRGKGVIKELSSCLPCKLKFNHDGEKELQIRHGPRIKLRHRAKDWTMRWELVGSSLGLHRRYREDC